MPDISFVSGVTATPGSTGGTTSAIDTTGANLLIVTVSYYSALSPNPTISDSKSNTWIYLTDRAGDSYGTRIMYAKNAIVGTGHTFTVTGAAFMAPTIIVKAFADADLVAPFVSESGAGTGSGGGTTQAPGSLTPPVDKCLIVSCMAANDTTGPFTATESLAVTSVIGIASVSVGGAFGWKVQSGAAAINPAWTWTTSTVGWTAMAVFRPPYTPVAPLLAVTAKASTDGNSVTTDAIDTDGADLLIVGVACNSTAGTALAVSDSKGNTWTALTFYGLDPPAVRLFYAVAPLTLGPGHTFTVTASAQVPSIHVSAWQNYNAFDGVQNGAGISSGSGSSGSITPTGDARLVVSLFATDAASGLTATVSGGALAIVPPQIGAVGSQHVGIGFAYEIQTTVATRSATWNWTSSAFADRGAATIAAFSKPIIDPGAGPLYVWLNDVPWVVRADSMEITATVNGRDVLSATFMVFPDDSPVFPEILDEIKVYWGDAIIFGGVIDNARKYEMSSDRTAGTFVDVNASDYNAIGDWRYTHGAYPGPYTLKEYLEILVPFLVGPLTTVTLDPAQLDGPDLPTQTWDTSSMSRILDALSEMTGWIHNIDYNGVLKMWETDTDPAAYDIDDMTPIGDVTVETSTQGYGNSVIIRAGETQQLDIVDTKTGDGVTAEFLLVGGVISHGGVVNVNGTPEAIGGVGDPWQFGVGVNSIVRTTAPAVGDLIEFPYFAQYPLIVGASDGPLILDDGAPIEQVFAEPKLTDLPQIQEMARGRLREVSIKRKTVRYTAAWPTLRPGTFQTIDLPGRQLVAEDFLITDVVTRMIGATRFHQMVTAVTPLAWVGSWRDLYKRWNKLK